MDAEIAATYGFLPASDAQRFGLFLNLPSVRANRVLDMVQAIGLAVSCEPQAMGELLLQAGIPPEAVQRAIVKLQMEKLKHVGT